LETRIRPEGMSVVDNLILAKPILARVSAWCAIFGQCSRAHASSSADCHSNASKDISKRVRIVPLSFQSLFSL
jgi:hypothetical protein